MMNIFRHAQCHDIQCCACQKEKEPEDQRPWFEQMQHDGINVQPANIFFCPECDPVKAGGTFCKEMYRIELFTPQQCPHCANPLLQENRDYVRYMGTIKDGVKTPDPDYPRIICKKCNGEPVKITMHEARQLSDREEAERLMRETNFVNLQVVTAFGNMTQDSITTYGPDNQPRLEKIDCTGE